MALYNTHVYMDMYTNITGFISVTFATTDSNYNFFFFFFDKMRKGTLIGKGRDFILLTNIILILVSVALR